MAGEKIANKVAGYLKDFLAAEDLELYHVAFVKEGKDYHLRVYIDKPAEDEYVGVADCEKVSQYLSDVLDQEDPIPQNYYLEVSSPGLDRELITDAHFEKFQGRLVDVKLYKAIDGQKTLTGTLIQKTSSEIILQEEGKEEPTNLPLAAVVKVRAAVVL